jgi:hypothetical protein
LASADERREAQASHGLYIDVLSTLLQLDDVQTQGSDAVVGYGDVQVSVILKLKNRQFDFTDDSRKTVNFYVL